MAEEPNGRGFQCPEKFDGEVKERKIFFPLPCSIDHNQEFDGDSRTLDINVFNGCKLSINKTFLPVKAALFCWFAAGNIEDVYLPVFLKLKGFSLVHLSLFSAIIDLTYEHNNDFGRQRVWSILGSFCGPPIAGFLLHGINITGNEKRYTMAFITTIVFTLLSALSLWQVKTKLYKPSAKMWRKALVLGKKLEVGSLSSLMVMGFFMVFVPFWRWPKYFTGKVITTTVGGYLMSEYGGRTAFRVLGSIALTYAIVYGSYLRMDHVRKKKRTIQSESSKEHI
ncbi:hypothetical protein TNIN_255741 [Trichonephila inaurata madagascariensis]|uniref:Major facilitator superfamily associated domain-containing protein n=1 Tax=Trichonephila inaurata madagascariensis TaxID=2747483 RepID=A0A8X6X9K8_9ARAC|nr:hypothetical protein TNIN_255741 [Trichonephila inaurata madagascariensis]